MPGYDATYKDEKSSVKEYSELLRLPSSSDEERRAIRTQSLSRWENSTRKLSGIECARVAVHTFSGKRSLQCSAGIP